MTHGPRSSDTSDSVSLAEAASLLGVHYMTAYRYVRRGQLQATRAGNRWLVHREDLDRFRSGHAEQRATGVRVGDSIWSQRYENRLLAFDAIGAWSVLDDARVAGMESAEIYLNVITPAMERIGVAWDRHEHTVAAEHAATGIVRHHLGRLSPSFTPRGPRRGTIVLGCPPGEYHELGIAMVADLFTAAGFHTVNLGANTPARAFQDAYETTDQVTAIGISSHDPDNTNTTSRLVDDLRFIAPHTPLIVGGRIANGSTAARLPADLVTNNIDAAIERAAQSQQP